MSGKRAKARRRPRSTYDVLEALIKNPATHAQVAAIPVARTGRPRKYPVFFWFVFEAAVSLYGSAQKVAREFAHPRMWRFLRYKVQEAFPNDPSRWLPDDPMSRSHYVNTARKYLKRADVLEKRRESFTREAVAQAQAMGLLVGGPGFTHPDLAQMVYGDGKVIEPLFKTAPGATRTDEATGEVKPVRFDPDANDHVEGGGEQVYGTKHLMVSTRGPVGRVILDTRYVPFSGKGGEPAVAIESFRRIAGLTPGVTGSSGTWPCEASTSIGSCGSSGGW